MFADKSSLFVVPFRSPLSTNVQLDPENNKSVMDIQSAMAAGGKDSGDEDEDDEEDDEEDAQMQDSDEDEIVEDDSEAPVIAKSSTHNFEGLLAQVQTAAQTPAQAPKSITELRAKLEERLAKLRGRRGATAEANASAKPTSRQAILEARLKRKKDKKASQKLAKEKRASGGSEGLIVKEASDSSAGGRPSASSINDKGEVRFSKFEFDGLQKKKRGPTDAQGQLKMVTFFTFLYQSKFRHACMFELATNLCVRLIRLQYSFSILSRLRHIMKSWRHYRWLIPRRQAL
jgi:hypothetical protein